MPDESEVILEYVEDARHLAEDQHPRPLGLELRQELVHELHLAAVLPDVRPVREGRAGLGAVEEVGVVAHLAQVHQDVLKTRLARPAEGVELVGVLAQYFHVPVALHVREADE